MAHLIHGLLSPSTRGDSMSLKVISGHLRILPITAFPLPPSDSVCPTGTIHSPHSTVSNPSWYYGIRSIPKAPRNLLNAHSKISSPQSSKSGMDEVPRCNLYSPTPGTRSPSNWGPETLKSPAIFPQLAVVGQA